MTERLTVCAPTSAHVYAMLVGRNVNVPPQLSVEPLLIWDDVTVALPEPSRVAVTSWHVATGGVASFTVTVAVQVAIFPDASDTVKVYEFAPTCVQSYITDSGE